MTEKKKLVRSVTPETEVSYGGLSVGFYDNPRTLITDGKEVVENRLYISVDLIAKNDHIKRLAKEGEIELYEKAYERYLKAGLNGGKLDTESMLEDSLIEKNKQLADIEKESLSKDAEIEALRKQLVKQQEAVKRNIKAE